MLIVFCCCSVLPKLLFKFYGWLDRCCLQIVVLHMNCFDVRVNLREMSTVLFFRFACVTCEIYRTNSEHSFFFLIVVVVAIGRKVEDEMAQRFFYPWLQTACMQLYCRFYFMLFSPPFVFRWFF